MSPVLGAPLAVPVAAERRRSRASYLVTFALGALAMVDLGVTGSARAQSFTEYPVPTFDSRPWAIAMGPDGNLWFVENSGSKIGRITRTGVVTDFAIPGIFSEPLGIAAGFDGNLWFTESNFMKNNIGRMTTSGSFTEYPIPSFNSGATGIAAGPDGALWFTEFGGTGHPKIGRIDVAGVITEFPILRGGPIGIAAAPDGNIWFTNPDIVDGDKIGRITPGGVMTFFPIPPNSYPWGITAGPDGNLWFAEALGDKIGRMTPTGVLTEFALPIQFTRPIGIAAGSDGNLWFTEYNNNKIGRITTTGVLTEFAVPTLTAGVSGITAGPDGALWFTEELGNRIGRITTGAVLAAPPTIVKSFDATSIALNASTTLRFSINNPNASTALTGVGFTDPLPAGLVISTPNALSGTCGGGTIVATAGSGVVTVASAALPANASCIFSVNVKGLAAGLQSNTTGPVASLEGGTGGTASATVTVIEPLPAAIPALSPWKLLWLGALILVAAAATVMRGRAKR